MFTLMCRHIYTCKPPVKPTAEPISSTLDQSPKKYQATQIIKCKGRNSKRQQNMLRGNKQS